MEKKSEVNFRIALYQPEIPANTGNIGRLCVGSNSELHIIKPMRFFINDKTVKRAGLDYWPKVKLFMHDTLEDLIAAFPDNNVYYCTTKTDRKYSEQKFQKGDIFLFGPESRGIPESYLDANPQECITIPMSSDIRSMNLSNSVAVILYEGLRQIDWNLF